jgi:signal peptidase
MGRVPVTRIVAFVLVAALVAAGWLLLGPAQLGGPARYAIIDGSSMAPTLTDGDLVVVRVDGEPAKGEVVLYRDPRLGVDVLHRVLRQTGGRFVLKGDGNDYADDARPTAAELQGTLWFSVPHLGAVVEWLRQPLHAGLVVFVLVALAFAGGEGAARRRSRPLWRAGAASPLSTRAAAARVLLAGAAAAAALFAVLSFAAFSLSTSRAETVDEARVHAATLSYSADVEASDVYPDGTVDAGETAFLQLVPALDVSAVYRFSAEGGADVRGRAAISAVVSDGAGWTREIPVAAPSEFSGSSVTVSGKLDLEELDGIVDEMRSLTGSLTTTFAVLLRTRVELSGRAGGDRLDEEFVPEIRFLLDALGPEGGARHRRGVPEPEARRPRAGHRPGTAAVRPRPRALRAAPSRRARTRAAYRQRGARQVRRALRRPRHLHRPGARGGSRAGDGRRGRRDPGADLRALRPPDPPLAPRRRAHVPRARRVARLSLSHGPS